ncbi:disulfide oxidoreductase YuzD [Bacillus thuringiensis]
MMCLCNKTSEYTVGTRSGGEEMVNVQVYGTKVICASCVGMPTSTETFEWLQAAIGRKYEGQENKFNFEYIDFQEEQEDADKKAFAERVVEEDLFYPVVLVNGEIVGEGNPRLKDVYEEIEKYL